jgi:hypothetical protein
MAHHLPLSWAVTGIGLGCGRGRLSTRLRAGALAFFFETFLVVVMLPNDELTAWLMSSVIKVPRRCLRSTAYR